MQLGIIHNSLVFSQTAWKALPDEYKKILEEARPEAYRLQIAAYEEADRKSIPQFEKRKLEIIKVSAEMREKLIATAGRPVWDQWVAETEKKGLPGKEALELVLSQAKKVTN
jgi:TRAP-type C4-dicarboxylate transport system substrate-binding protein